MPTHSDESTPISEGCAEALRFGPFVLELAQARLSRDGVPLAVRPKALELLGALASRPGQLVTKDALLDAVWGRRHISEGVIKSAVAELRELLGDDSKSPRWIETVPRRGYRFAGQVHEIASAGQAAPIGDGDMAAAKPQEIGGNAVAIAPIATASGGGHVAPSALMGDVVAERPKATTPVPIRGNMPEAITALIGREPDLAAVEQLVQAARLVTIAGPSGIGKTSLALAHAAATVAVWPDGVWLVELTSLPAETTTEDHLVAAFVQSLQLDTAIRGRSALASALAPLEMLLVLDNAEHVLEPLAALLASVIGQAPRLHILLTTQEPLRLAGEQVYRLAPLALPALASEPRNGPATPANVDTISRLLDSGAVRLFVERVAARQPGFCLTPPIQDAVVTICRALDGLPLALELAAARVPMLGVHAIASALADDDGEAEGDGPKGGQGEGRLRLQLLTQGARGAARRQRTLREALAWSHALLDAPQRRVFRRVSVFRGGFTLALAQAIAVDDEIDDWAVLEAVQALVDKSLLVAMPDDDPTRPPRFRLLESPRAFALERLAEAGETAALRWRHLQAIRAVWQRADASTHAIPTLEWLAINQPEVHNLRAALRWALADDAALARAATAAAPHSSAPAERGAVAGTPDGHAATNATSWRPPANHGEPGVTAAALSEAADAALALVVAACGLWYRGGLAMEGRDACERVRARAALTGDARLAAGWSLSVAALGAYASAYPPDEALRQARSAAAAYAALGERQRTYFATYLEYQLQLRAGVIGVSASTIARMVELEDPAWGELATRYLRFARSYEDRVAGRQDAYRTFCREELLRYRRLGALSEGWAIAQGLMLAEHDRGDVAAALAAGRDTLTEIRAAGRLAHHGSLFALYATMLVQVAPPAEARVLLGEALPMLRRAGTPWMLHAAMAWLPAAEGRFEDAAQLTGWLDAAGRNRTSVAAGSTVSSALRKLLALLAQHLGAAALERWQADGRVLDEGAAEQLAFGASGG
ncbi:MAG: winged helix-turn-helix domain-containing protein [Ideonella sp.]